VHFLKFSCDIFSDVFMEEKINVRVQVVLKKLEVNYVLKNQNRRQLFNFLNKIPIKSYLPMNSL